MIVPCPACRTRFNLDPKTVPPGGVRFRCGRCRKLFRMTVRFKTAPVAPVAQAPPAHPAARSVPVAAQADPPREQIPIQSRAEPATGPATRIPAPRSEELAHVNDIQRVARVAVSDLELYDAARVEAAILGGRFLEDFRGDLDETRRLVRVRHKDVPDAVGLFDRTIEALCEQRRLKALAAK